MHRPRAKHRVPALLILVLVIGGWVCLAAAQPKGQIVSGRVTGSIAKVGEAGVSVRLLDGSGIVQGTTTGRDGAFELHLNHVLKAPIYVLYNKLNYLTQIRRIDPHWQEPQEVELEPSLFAPNYVQINGSLQSAEQSLARISGAAVYANQGLYNVNSSDEGEFQLPISVKSDETQTILWVETKSYKPHVQELSLLPDANHISTVVLSLIPTRNTYTYEFVARRGDTEEALENVTVTRNGLLIGKTDKNGSFSHTFFADQEEQNVVVFSYPRFESIERKYDPHQPDVNEVITFKTPRFNVEPLVFFDSDSGEVQRVAAVRYFIGRRTNRPRWNKGVLSFSAFVGDTLWAELDIKDRNELIRYSEHRKGFVLTAGMTALKWQLVKSPLTVKIQVDSSAGYALSSEDELFLVHGTKWIKAKPREESFEVASNQLNHAQQEGWRIVVLSSKFEPHPLITSHKPSPEGVILTILPKNKSEEALMAQRDGPLDSQIPASGVGTLFVTTSPPKAAIGIEELPKLQTKLSPDSLQLPHGKYTVRVSKEDYATQYRVISLETDSVTAAFDLGNALVPQARLSHLRIAAELGGVGWFLPQQARLPFPALKVGGNLFVRLSEGVDLKVSYLAGRAPRYYLDQVFGLGIVAGFRRLHWAFEFRELRFEASKEIIAKFDGESLVGNFWLCVGSEAGQVAELPFVKRYRRALLFGYESSLGSINETVAGPHPREQELSLGLLQRWGRGFFDLHAGVLLDRVTILDEAKNNRERNVEVRRLTVRYLYFLN